MTEVSVRDLRNHGGDVLDSVMRGESVTVTRQGQPVAELRPIAAAGTLAATLLERWHAIPVLDLAAGAMLCLGDHSRRVAAELRASGRKTSARAYDALIAATVVANELPLFTLNVDDFSGISSLTVVEVEPD